MKTAAFTVHGTGKQSLRWKRAASGEGFPSVGAWLAEVADLHLQGVARSGRPILLAWRRGSFKVRLEGGELVPVSGHVSPPFGSFSGTEEGPARSAEPSASTGIIRDPSGHGGERQIYAHLAIQRY